MTRALPPAFVAAGWVPAPALSDALLSGSIWAHGMAGAPAVQPFLVLAPDGLIGNYADADTDFWHCPGGCLTFVGTNGLPATRFVAARLDGNRLLALAGPGPGGGWRVLTATGHPAHPIHPTPPDAPRRTTFLRRLDAPLRPNLVILRAGPGSLHRSWWGDAPDAPRNWDLCISVYDGDPEAVGAGAEYLTHQPEQRKFQAVFDLFHPESPLAAYDRIWLPDDDLLIGVADINRCFHLSRKYALDLAQPALRPGPDCFFVHPVTARRPGSLLRYVGFVEIMCPLFSARALRLCLPTFRDAWSGYGLDFLWPSLLGGPQARIGIIDAVTMIHTRPIGGGYDVSRADAEWRATLAAYHFRQAQVPELTVPLPAPPAAPTTPTPPPPAPDLPIQ